MPRARLKRQDDRDSPGLVARLMMAASALLVAALFAYMVQQAVTAPPDALPQARVVDVRMLESSEVLVEVEVANDAAAGLRELVVEVACDDPPPEVSLANVPAQGARRAFVVCPPGSTAPEASVSSFTRA